MFQHALHSCTQSAISGKLNTVGGTSIHVEHRDLYMDYD